MCFEIGTITEKEKQELMIWTGNSLDNGETINQKLRANEALSDIQAKRLEIVVGAINKSKTTAPITLYRVWGQCNTKTPYNRNRTVIDNGVMEASLSENIDLCFPWRRYYLIINVPAGVKCLPISKYNGRVDENGVLFLPQTALKVDCVKKSIFQKQVKIFCSVVPAEVDNPITLY